MKKKLEQLANATFGRYLSSLHAIEEDSTLFKVLVVDDEAAHLQMMELLVTSFGYECDTAQDGEEAVQYLSTHACDLVLTDLMMPKMNGRQLLEHIKKKYPEMIVIVLTGFSKDCSFIDLIRAGAADFLEKPVDKEVLEAKLARFFYEKTLIMARLNEIKTQKVLIDLLSFSFETKGLDELLHDFLTCITSFPWLDLEPKGAILLVDKNDKNILVLSAHHQLAPPLQSICARVPLGSCLCGRAALTRKVVFAGHLDADHENTFAGIEDHGHYCVPIIPADGELLGVFTLYTKAGASRDRSKEIMLLAAAKTMAGIIKSKQTELLVAQHEKRCRAMTDNVLDGIIMMDNCGLISFWNPAAARIFGYSEEEALGRNLHEFLVPEQYKPASTSALHDFLRSGSGNVIGKSMELTASNRNGREIPIEISLSGIRDQDAWYAVGIVRDLSEKKKVEEEKERITGQIRQAQKMEAIGTLAGGIAHDFNNILGAIIGFADIAKEEVPAESQVHSDLERILAAGNRAKELVRQILTFSRQREKEFIPVKINLILKEALKLLRATIPTSIEIIQDIDPESRPVLADPTQIHQVIMNLCTNAYYAMRQKGGRLSISLNNENICDQENNRFYILTDGDYVKMRIADTGAGIDKEVMERIFEPYYTTKPFGEGTGLGLSLVHGIITGLRGAVEVQSEPGQGTEFTIYIPAYSAGDLEKDVSGRKNHIEGGKEHILLVDDEVALVEVCARQLKNLGYTVTSRTSSVEALAAFAAQPDRFDLVITDLAMPNMTGLDMAAELLKIRPKIPIILTTGFVDNQMPEYALSVGIKKIVNKPVRTHEIALYIRELLNGKND